MDESHKSSSTGSLSSKARQGSYIRLAQAAEGQVLQQQPQSQGMSRSKSLAARLGLVADHGDAEGELGGIGMPITERGESQDSAHEEAETQRLITSSMRNSSAMSLHDEKAMTRSESRKSKLSLWVDAAVGPTFNPLDEEAKEMLTPDSSLPGLDIQWPRSNKSGGTPNEAFRRNASRKSRLDLVSALRDQERDLEGGEAVEEVESEEEKNRIARLSLYTRPSLPSRGFFFNFRRPILVTLISVMLVASVLTGVLLQSKPKNSSSPPPPVGVPTKPQDEPAAPPVKIDVPKGENQDPPKVENQAEKIDPIPKPKAPDTKKTDEGAVASGIYRNLFVELLGKSEADVKAKLDAGFSHLFHGDALTETILYEVGDDMAYVVNTEGGYVTTEGMSYGMMIAVQMDKKAEFDRLWKWTRTYMMHHDGIFQGFFAWKCDIEGTKLDNTPAPDGEEYFATALIFAAKRWGSSKTKESYAAEAVALLGDLQDRTTITMFTDAKHVVFSPMSAAFTDPSYHVPAFYQVWASFSMKNGLDGSFWIKAAEASRTFLEKIPHKATGLVPDYSDYEGNPVVEGGRGATFGYDAWRVPHNIAVDWAWWRNGNWQPVVADKIQNFFIAQGLKTYGAVYTLDGNVVEKHHPIGLIAMNAVTALASTNDEHAKLFLQEFWDAPLPTGKYRYYNAVLYMMAFLHCSGNFKAYM